MVGQHMALQTRGLTKAFPGRGGESTVALEDIDLHVERGEFVCLVGASGCGKSTLLNIIAGLIEPTEGEALLDGLPIGGPSPDRGLVSQGYSLLPWRTVAKNVAFGLELSGWSKPGSTEEERMSSCGWVLRCSWDNGFAGITSQLQGAPIRCYQRATLTG